VKYFKGARFQIESKDTLHLGSVLAEAPGESVPHRYQSFPECFERSTLSFRKWVLRSTLTSHSPAIKALNSALHPLKYIIHAVTINWHDRAEVGAS
jgi:hypothetical protein